MELSNIILVIVVLFIVGRQYYASTPEPIPETSEKVQKVTEAAELVKILTSTKDVIVDFYADWCPPCRAIAPVFSALAEQHAEEERLAFVKVNVDDVKEIAQLYQVTAMPTFLVFRGGKPRGVKVEGMESRTSFGLDAQGGVERIMGADKGGLEALVNALLKEESA